MIEFMQQLAAHTRREDGQAMVEYALILGLVSVALIAVLGTMRTDTPTFAGLIVGTVVLIGALTFFPALLLGPVVQGMTNQLF